MENSTSLTIAEKIRRDYMSRKFILSATGMISYLAYCFVFKNPVEPIGVATIIAAYGLVNIYGAKVNGG